MGSLHGTLDVLRVVVLTIDDDEVFLATTDEELTVVEEAEVTWQRKH